MAREGLRYDLSNAFHKALEQKTPVVVHGLKVGTNGGRQSWISRSSRSTNRRPCGVW
jgi:hypothetical protein